jgi:hypothetical protein
VTPYFIDCFLLCIELLRLLSSAPDEGNAFDLVAGLKTVGIALGSSVDDEEGNQAFGQTDIPADPRQGLTFATRQLDPALIVEKPLAVRSKQSDWS